MAQNEQPYDPYIPSGSAGAQASNGQNGSRRTAELQEVSCFPNPLISGVIQSNKKSRRYVLVHGERLWYSLPKCEG
jgi:hypothetical protein